MARSSVVLPLPLGPSRPKNSPSAKVERDAGQRRHGAVVLFHPIDLDDAHLSPPKRYSRAKISISPMETRMMMVEMALISGVKPLRIAE